MVVGALFKAITTDGGSMNKGIGLFVLFLSLTAQASPVCVGKTSELQLIKGLLNKVNLFGTWQGEVDGKIATALLGQNKDGELVGKVEYDGDEFGPTKIKICDDNGSYHLEALGYEIVFEVLSKTKIKGYSPFDENDTLILEKK
jgi:hypothetical protein